MDTDGIPPEAQPLGNFPLDNLLCGVYFLMKDNECVYIGSSSHVYKRIAYHQSDSNKHGKFNRVLFIPTFAKYRDILEKYLIAFYEPTLNIYNDLDHKPTLDEVKKEINKIINL